MALPDRLAAYLLLFVFSAFVLLANIEQHMPSDFGAAFPIAIACVLLLLALIADFKDMRR